MPAPSSAAASRSMSVADACRTVEVRTCSAVVMAMLAPEPHESREVPANGLLYAIASLRPEPQRGEPGRVAQHPTMLRGVGHGAELLLECTLAIQVDRKSTRLNSSHSQISYAVFCLKKKKTTTPQIHLDFSHLRAI